MKQAPSNLSAEAAVLGSVLYDNAALLRIKDVLQPDDFYAPQNRRIYEAMLSLHGDGKLADGVTMREFFEREESLEAIGGAKYLGDLLDSAAFGPEVEDYTRIITDMASRRRLIDVAAGLQKKVIELPLNETVDDLIGDHVSEVSVERDRRVQGGAFEAVTETALAACERIDTIMETGIDPGLRCGLEGFDDAVGGLHPGDLIVIAGRPGMMKTGLARNVMFGAAERGRKCAFFSLEMPKEQLAWRAMSATAHAKELGRVEYKKIRSGGLGQNEAAILKEGARLLPATIRVDDRPSLTVEQIGAGARAVRKQLGGLDLLVIDYLQIMDRRIGKGLSTADATGLVTQGLKRLAKEMGIPVILLAQLSRSVDARDDKRPRLSDLKDSSSIEQDADVVLFAYRDFVYAQNEKPPENRPQEVHQEHAQRIARGRNLFELFSGKQRNNSVSDVSFWCDPGCDLILDEAPDFSPFKSGGLDV